MSPKPPDILRKSHRHTERKERAVTREDLRRAAAEELAASDAYIGACHCGALGYRFRTRIRPADWSVRACECDFCRRHGAAYTSDPQGSVAIVVGDADALQRYRFGLETADFLLCRRCGDLVAAVLTSDRGSWAAVNLELLDDPSPDLPLPQPVDYGAESRTERLRRREAQWTPVEAALGG